jgi:hypothetical protein
MSSSTSTARRFIAVGALALLSVACGDDEETTSTTEAVAGTTAASDTTTAAAETTAAVAETTVPATEMPVMYEGELLGTFTINAGDCSGGSAAGSYFRMVMAGGTVEAGPFIDNADSTCADVTYTLLQPGADSGLMTGEAQVAPDPAFDATGAGLADLIFLPVKFFGGAFAGAMDAAEAVPTITATDGVLSGDLSAFTAYWGGLLFNQGAPKPDGSGETVSGTIDPDTGAYTLDWTSLIAGGSFDGFTGVWHLEGTFTPAG